TWYQPAEPAWGPVAHGYRFAPGDEADTPIDLADGSSITPFASVVTAAAGAGGIAASSSDVARWVRALFGGGVLRADTLGAMLGDVTRTERYHPTVPYGLGVQSTEVGGRPSLGHSGRLLGFRSVARWLPRERIAIAVLTNQSRTDPGIIARALLKIALRAPDGCACVDRR
ncbi:MAG TPA: serine hydrolase domain-containing protein, partial [Candidatus Limnocylindrales bacterium]